MAPGGGASGHGRSRAGNPVESLPGIGIMLDAV
jgi:hypothetical protein